MSAYGYKQTLVGLKTTSASPPTTDVPGKAAEGPFLTQRRSSFAVKYLPGRPHESS